MKPIIVTYSNQSYVMTTEGWAALKHWGMGFFMQLGVVVASGLIESDIKLIAKPKQKDKTPVTNY